MDDAKICSRCGGAVDISVERDSKGGTSAVGRCRACGTRFDEPELLKLSGGPGPVGG